MPLFPDCSYGQSGSADTFLFFLTALPAVAALYHRRCEIRLNRTLDCLPVELKDLSKQDKRSFHHPNRQQAKSRGTDHFLLLLPRPTNRKNAVTRIIMINMNVNVDETE